MRFNTVFYRVIGATILVSFLACTAFLTFSSVPVCADDGGLSSPWDEVNGGGDTTTSVPESSSSQEGDAGWITLLTMLSILW